jgi:ribosomal protein S18 acetylase RimI-like enzyme
MRAADAGVRIEHPTEADHRAVVDVLDDWWGRRIHLLLPRLWFQHFASTSLVARGERDALLGFLVGFVSQDRPAEAYLHLVGVLPGRRRRGLGRALVERFTADLRTRGVEAVATVSWPGDPRALAFLRAMGFEVDAGPGTRPLYGTPAHTDWNRDRDDQVVLSRKL